MSHKATNWMAAIPADELGHSEFRVLFHLCDCHNPAGGCFPTQAYLLDKAGVSNGTLNNVLKSLEQKGLIQRKRVWDNRTKKQKPTRYILGFEIPDAQEPSPKNGDGKRGEPSPKNGDGADSNLDHEPSPTQTTSRLQPTGEGTCKEPVNNRAGRRRVAKNGACSAKKPGLRISTNPGVVADAERAVRDWRDGRRDAFDEVPVWVVGHVVAAGLLTPEERQRAGLS